MSDRELILESELELAREMIGDLKNCANCIHFRFSLKAIKCLKDRDMICIKPMGVCSNHEWDKIERREKSYD